MADGKLVILPIRFRPDLPAAPEDSITFPEIVIPTGPSAPATPAPAPAPGAPGIIQWLGPANPFAWPLGDPVGAPRSGPGILGPHSGQDFSMPCGTPIAALRPGVVIREGWATDGVTGIFVYLRYDDGTYAIFAHLADTVVDAGQRVDALTLIGHTGQTGNSIGCHLHLELHDQDNAIGTQRGIIDPRGYFADLR